MSIEAFSWALGVRVGSQSRKLVLLGYANHAHKSGRHSYPSKPTVAEYAECDTKTVKRAVKDLVAGGWMTPGDQSLVEHIRADKRPIVYDLAMSEQTRAAWQAAHERGDTVTPRTDDLHDDHSDDRGDTLTRRDQSHGGTPGALRGDKAVSPEPNEPNTPLSPHHCSRHPTAPGDNCRTCGTTPKQRAEADEKAAAAQKRAADRAALAADRARRAAAGRARLAPAAQDAIAEARTKIRTTVGAR